MSRQSGFTLLEVMIATVLLALMMTLLLAGMRIGADSWEQGGRISERASRLLVADNFFRSHLSDIKPLFKQLAPGMPQLGQSNQAGQPGQLGQPSTLMFQGGPQFLEYVGTLPPQVRGGIYTFRLALEEGDGRSDLKLAIRPLSSGDKGGDAPIEDVLVLEEVERLGISYYKKTNAQGGSQWVDGWNENFLPSLIKIDITLRGEPPWPSILVAPRAETGQ